MLLLEGVIRVVLKSSQQRFPCHSSAKCELEMHIRDEGDDDDATLTTDEQQTTKQSRSLHSIVNSSKLEYSGCVDGSACHMWDVDDKWFCLRMLVRFLRRGRIFLRVSVSILQVLMTWAIDLLSLSVRTDHFNLLIEFNWNDEWRAFICGKAFGNGSKIRKDGGRFFLASCHSSICLCTSCWSSKVDWSDY